MPPVWRFSHFVMATHFEAVFAEVERSYAEQVSLALFQELERLESRLSCFDPGSDISRINRLEPGRSIRIGVEAFECLRRAETLRAELGNAFDINFKLAGEDPYEPGTLLQLAQVSGGFTAGRSVREEGKGDSGLALDLGGIGKGYALDFLVELMNDWGIENYLLHAGTSTALARGSAPGTEGCGWPVGIAGGWDCYTGNKELVLCARAISGSGTEVKGPHVVDPGTGLPAEGHAAAWVSCPAAADSDALSTAFMVMNTAQVENYCSSHPEVWALVFSDENNYRIFNPDIF